MTNLFSSISMGDLTLANRVVMAPMTRNRADVQGVPPAIMNSTTTPMSATTPKTR